MMDEREDTTCRQDIAGSSAGTPAGVSLETAGRAYLNAHHDKLCQRFHGRWEGLELVEPPDPDLTDQQFLEEHARIHQFLRIIPPETP